MAVTDDRELPLGVVFAILRVGLAYIIAVTTSVIGAKSRSES
jgi:hypothetical protein